MEVDGHGPPEKRRRGSLGIAATLPRLLAAAVLPTLPTEIIDNIGSFLPDPSDTLNLRLTCRTLAAKAHRAHLCAHFAVVRINLDLDGLQELQRIAKNEKRRHIVRELHIGGLQDDKDYPVTKRDPAFGFWFPDGELQFPLHPDTRSPRLDKVAAILRDGLVNCRSFKVTYSSPLDRSRNHMNLGVALLLMVFLRAGVAPHSVVFHFERKPNPFRPFHDNDIHPALLQLPQFCSLWEALSAINIPLELRGPDPSMMSLILLAKNLDSLSLVGDYRTPRICLHRALRALDDTDGGLPPIRELELRSMDGVDARILKRLLGRFRGKLTTLNLAGITLMGGLWRDIYAVLAGDFPNLRSITQIRCQEILGRRDDGYFTLFGRLRNVPPIHGCGRFVLHTTELYPRSGTGAPQSVVWGVRFQCKEGGAMMRAALRAMGKAVYSTNIGLPGPKTMLPVSRNTGQPPG